MGDLRPFQIALLGGFALLAVVGLFLLSTFTPGASDEAEVYGTVTIWGTQSESAFQGVLRTITEQTDAFRNVEYRQIDAANFEAVLTNAIAEGRSPDLLAISHKQLAALRTKLIPLNDATVPLRDFRNAYVDGAEIFILSDGTYALPYGVDPIVQFWNRDLFATAGFAKPPTTWEEVINTTVPTLVRRTATRDIITAVVAFGEYRNVGFATDILSLLMIQSGSTLVREAEGRYTIDLNKAVTNTQTAPLTTAVDFYTRFSNPNTALYTWNRAQRLDRDEFTSGELAIYFAPGSERSRLSRTNPNLNFDVAPVPQGAGATVRRTFGTFYGFAIPRASANPGGALAVARTLAAPQAAAGLTKELEVAPVLRSLVGSGQNDPFAAVIYPEALSARGWLSPLPASTEAIFQRMIESVTTNNDRISGAVTELLQQLGQAY